MDYYKQNQCSVDLMKPLRMIPVEGVAGNGDSLADEFSVAVTRNGANVDLTGAEVKGYFIGPDGVTQKLSGTGSGNVAAVRLTAPCYQYEGAYHLAVKLRQGGAESTVAIFYGAMAETISDRVLEGNRTVYDVNAILTLIDEMEAASSAIETAAQAAQQAASAADGANEAAQSAAQAAEGANAWANAAAAVTSLAPESAPTVSVTTQDGAKLLSFGIPKGEQGEQGAPYTIKGAAYATLAALTAGVQSPQMGDQYNVGEEAPYNVYRWTGSGWEDQGQLGVPMENSTPTKAGLMSAEDKSKLDGIEARAVLAPRPNLLDNWYFANPVNQRGQTEYTATGYTIDRWRNNSTSLKASVVSNGLRITATGTTYKAFTQRLENVGDILGRTVTVSALMTGLTNLSESDINFRVWASNGSSLHTSYLLTANQKITVGNQVLFVGTATLPETISYSGANVGVSINEDVSANAALTLVACKLEYGSMQTLARQEGGAWVLNEVPDYSAEFAKCQRYVRAFNWDDPGNKMGFGNIRNDTQANIYFPFGMRAIPVIHNQSSNMFEVKVDGQNIAVTSLTAWFANEDTIGVRANGNFAGKQNKICVMSVNTATTVLFSADL